MRLDLFLKHTRLVKRRTAAKAAAAGATAYYTKPFSPIALLKEIDRLRAQREKA